MNKSYPYSLRPFHALQNHSLAAFLQHNLSAEAIHQTAMTRKVYLDPNFDPEGAFVVRDTQDEIVGFALAIARRHPLEDGPDDRDRGWITLFAVAEDARRRGIGSLLFETAEEWLRTRGCASVWISPYAPGYWTPGVDEAVYPAALAFLAQRGYETQYRPLSMQANLGPNWRIPKNIVQREETLERDGIDISCYWRGHCALSVTQFVRQEFPGDWQRVFRETLLDIEAERRSHLDIWFAHHGSTIVGVAQHDGERFGPIGVAREWRGRQVGAILMYRTLESMRERGLRNAWFMWTDDKTAERLYKPAGFEETRRYAVLRKNLL